MKSIELSRGLFAVVDDDDYDFLMQWKWTALVAPRTFYAYRRQRMTDRKYAPVFMHRLLLATPEGMVTDHIDGDGLNNTRGNLRIATQRQNMMNRRPQRGGTCPLKGVWRDNTAPRKPWRSAIRVNGRLVYLGRFDRPEDAASAYATAASEYFGEFHRISEGSQNP